jgi:type IV fimbrial biogenesis protein FimT
MRRRGLTLLELLIALAVLAIVATVALPSFGSVSQRARLRAAAEMLASDLAEARFESARAGRPLHLWLDGGAAWCWSVATAADCGCREAASCQLKRVLAREHGGIELLEARPASFDPAGTAAVVGGAVLRSSAGDALKVELSALGRARVCAASGSVPGYPAC